LDYGVSNHYPNSVFWFDQQKKPKQNGCVQVDLSKMAFWSSWTRGRKDLNIYIYIIDFSSWKSHIFLYWVDVNIKCLVANLVHRQNQTFAKRMKIKLVAIGENPKKVLNYNQFWTDSISPNQNQWLATSKHHTTKLLNFD
jgi:hypothetical protein